MHTHKFLPAIFCTILTVSLGGCFSFIAAANKPLQQKLLPSSLYNPVLAQNAQLRVSDNVWVLNFDGHETNWPPGTVRYIPAGRHTINVATDQVSGERNMQPTFLPGKCYIVDFEITDSKSETVTTSGGGRTSYTTTTYTAGNFRLSEYGAAEFTVPGKNESLVEIRLGGGSYTRLIVNGGFYKLSSYARDAAQSVRFILPAGTHRIGSLATVDDINLELPPNRYIVYSINTRSATCTKEYDRPLAYIGRWHFDLGGGRSIVFTFNTGGNAFLEMYAGNTLAEGGGAFTYTATGTALTIKTPDDGPGTITMPYRLTSDQNSIYLDNFLGSSTTLMGTR